MEVLPKMQDIIIILKAYRTTFLFGFQTQHNIFRKYNLYSWKIIKVVKIPTETYYKFIWRYLKESKLFINYMNILLKERSIWKNKCKTFYLKIHHLHQMVKFPMSPKKNSEEEKIRTLSQWNGEMPTPGKIRINKFLAFSILIRTAGNYTEFTVMKTLDFLWL